MRWACIDRLTYCIARVRRMESHVVASFACLVLFVSWRYEWVSCMRENVAFCVREDMYAKDSIDLLTSCGILFKKHEEDGIEMNDFAELLMTSGVVLSDTVKWISFHRYGLICHASDTVQVKTRWRKKSLWPAWPNVNVVYEQWYPSFASDVSFGKRGDFFIDMQSMSYGRTTICWC